MSGSKERLIKLTLKGVSGEMTVDGKTYSPENGVPPMTPFEGLLDDDEAAAVLTYIRNSFGNRASTVSAAEVAAIREATREKTGFFMVEELLADYPLENDPE